MPLIKGYSQTMKNHLVPVTITDKNNRKTTVYRKPEPTRAAGKKIPAATIPSTTADMRKSAPLLLSLGLESMGDKVRREKAELMAGADEKAKIISRLTKLHSGFAFPLPLETHYLESFQIMDRIMSGDPLQKEFITQTHARFVSIKGPVFRSWAQVADRNYDALTTNPAATPETPDVLPGLFSAAIYLHDRHRQTPLTEEQELNYLILNIAAIDSTLEGKRIREGSNWGLIACIDNPDLEDFALTCDDPERLQRVANAIRRNPITRFQEAVAIADGETIGTLSDGIL